MENFGENQSFQNVENIGTQESQTQPILTQGDEGGAGGRVSNSDIFKIHFKKIASGDKIFKVICNYCSKEYAFKHGGGYGTFQKHIIAKHPDKVGMARGQTQLTGFASSSSQPNLFRYNHDESSMAFAEMVAVDHLSFSFAEKLGFNKWIKEHCQPAYKPITRHTVRKNLFKLYKNLKKELLNYFQSNDIHVSICADIWSDHTLTHSYMGITCHWIDENFILQKRVLAYRCFNESDSALNICRLIHNILE